MTEAIEGKIPVVPLPINMQMYIILLSFYYNNDNMIFHFLA